MTSPLDVMRTIVGTQWDGGPPTPQIKAMEAAIMARFPDLAGYLAGADKSYFAWCGFTCGYCAAQCGMRPPSEFLLAASWRNFGSAADTPQPGDVAVFDWGSGPHHVTLIDRIEGENYVCLGGNQSHEVKDSTFHRSQCVAVRRPVTQTSQPIIVPQAAEQFANSGRGSWYSQFVGKYQWIDNADSPGSNALGVPDDAQGISFYDHATLGHWFQLRAPNGVTSIEQQTEIGPNPRTGRTIDISAVCAERLGYSPHDFPTDSTFSWSPIAAPASVAHLSPQQQAVAYCDLRGKIMTDIPVPVPQPIPQQPIIPSSPFHFDLQALVSYITEHPAEAQQMIGFQAAAFHALFPGLPLALPGLAVAPVAPVAAPVAPVGTPALQRPSVQASIGALALSVLGQITHLIGFPEIAGVVPPDASTHVGTLSTVIPLLTGAVGASGGFASLLKVAAKIFAIIPK